MIMAMIMTTTTAIIIERFEADRRQKVRLSDETRPKAPKAAAGSW